MQSLNTFKKYFNREFWKSFNEKSIFEDVPASSKEKGFLVEKLYKEIETRKYYPSTPTRFIDINKGYSVTRMVPVFTVKDYCLYYFCIKQLEEKIAINRVKNTFGGWTLGGLIRRSEREEIQRDREDYKSKKEFIAELNGFSISEYSFNPFGWVISYGELNACLYMNAKKSKFKYVAELDIANFYDSVRLDILENKIKEAHNHDKSEEINLLFHFLNYWNRNTNLYNKQTVGLPQDAMGDCSRILANYYLQDYDKFTYDLCKKNNSVYMRYSDDQFLFSDSLEQLHFLIFRVSKELSKIGLSINQRKVKITTTKDLIENRSFKLFDIISKKEDKNDVEKVKRYALEVLELLQKNKFIDIQKKATSLLNRLIFCPALKKLDSIIIDSLFIFYEDEEYLRNAKTDIFKNIYEIKSKKDRIIFIRKLNSLSEKFIHNSFHYHLLDFYKRKKINSRANLQKRIKTLTCL